MLNPFFINRGPIFLYDVLKLLNIKNETFKNEAIEDIKDLTNATKKNITFFHSKKYQEYAKITKASYCVTTKQLL